MNEALEIKEKLESLVTSISVMLDNSIDQLKTLECKFKNSLDDKDLGFIQEQQKEVDKFKDRLKATKDALDITDKVLNDSYNFYVKQEELERDRPIPVQYC